MDDDQGHFSVVAVTCFPSRGYQKTIQVNFTQRSTAYGYCDQLQDEIDRDCQPARAYVIDRWGVPIRAARCRTLPANYFFMRHELRRPIQRPKARAA